MKHKLTDKHKKARKMLCLPLDNLNSLLEIKNRVKALSPYVGLFKIGKETFTRFGQEAIDIVYSHGSEVFLDLKYHDIPNTVAGASEAATEKAIWMFNIHLSGGREQIRRAVKTVNMASNNYSIRRPKLIGVTVLTSIGPAEYLDINLPLVPNLSTDDLKPYYGMKTDANVLQVNFALMLQEKGYHYLVRQTKQGLRSNVIEQAVLNLAKMAYNEGCDGIVCSAADLPTITSHFPKDFMYATPGITRSDASAGKDQKRTAKPDEAVRNGSSIIIAGRTITGSEKIEEQQDAAYEVLDVMASEL